MFSCPSNLEISKSLQEFGFNTEVVPEGVVVSLNRYLWNYEVEFAVDAHLWELWVGGFRRIDKNSILVEIER